MRRLSRTALLAGAICSFLPGYSSLYALDSSRNLTQYVHRIWQVQQGLPVAPIYAITQAHDGYIWLGTGNGVVRFDGVRFSQVPALAKHPLADPWVSALVEDSVGRMWIRTNDWNLVRVAGDDVKTFGKSDGLPSSEVSCLTSASDGGIWACTPTGLAHFNGDKLDFHPAPDGKFPIRLTHACESSDHIVWAGGASPQLFTLNGSQFDSYTIQLLPAAVAVRSMRCAADRLWVGTTEGLVELKDREERRFLDRDGLPDNVAMSLGVTGGDDLWIGTRKGLSRYRNSEFTNYGTRDGLSQSTVYATYEDREGSIWVGTKSGLNQFVDSETTLYTTAEGLPGDNMGPVLEDRKGQVWGGTLGSGLFRFDGRRFSILRHKDGLGSDTVIALAEDPAGGVWAGTSRGLNHISEATVGHTYSEAHGLPSSRIRALFFDHSNVLWAATDGGVAQLKEGRFVPASDDRELRRRIAAVGEGKDGGMLFAVADGPVYRLASGKLTKIGDARVRDVDTFYTDPNGYVWMGTYGGGLILLKDGKITHVTMREGLPDGQIFDIAADGPDRLWIACSNGYYSVSRSNLLDFAAGKSRKIESTSYNSTLRLRTIESQSGVQPVVWKSRNGMLWFSTIRGLLEFEPQRRVANTRPLQTVIDEVVVNGESVKPDEIESLAPGKKSITFHYTTLSFLHPEQMTFRYRLDGYDANWVEAGNRRDAFYTNLPPGEYRLQVIACQIEGDCAASPASVRFSLASQWYQQAWFIPAIVILLGIMGWGGYLLRVHHLHEQFLIVVGERNRIARELHDTLIQGFSGITMQMQALSGRLRGKEERDALEDIIRDAGTCLQETRRSVAGLRSQSAGVSGLATALAETARQLTEQRDVRLRLKLEEESYEISPEVKYNLLRIAQEAVTNSVKHSGARTIEVGLDHNATGVHLSISDDGRGFPRDGKTRTQPLHYGIVGMRERANQIGANFDLASTPGRGTQIRVSIPLNPEESRAAAETQEMGT